MFYENDDSPSLSLNGEWEFRLGNSTPRKVGVPAAWETYTPDKLTDGPGVYRREFIPPEAWSGGAIVLEVGTISFDASVRVNGKPAGSHRGMWSPFQLDVTRLVRPGKNEIEIEVWKPGGRFPLRESLAGFLPDVCTTFGGIWQGIRLRAHARAALSGLRMFSGRDGVINVAGDAHFFREPSPPQVRIELLDDSGRSMASCLGQVDDDARSFGVRLSCQDAATRIREWAPDGPAEMYTLSVTLYSGEARLARASRRIGFREITVRDGIVRLGSAPFHVRGVLDWGWNPERICPAPSREEILGQFARARSLGFNLVKLCLFVPDELTFDLADEEGMPLWLEMPMWLPRVTPEFRALALAEYEAVFRRLHHHPSIVLLSLGCELNAEADDEFLRSLSALAREWFPNALHCDNSGSAEAYGGVATTFSDFYDYHFYADPHFFRPLVHHFHRSYRPDKPWIYGEFCDADTLRDFTRLSPEPWWLIEPVALDRDDFLHTRDFKRRLAEAGVADGGAELTRIARRQATAIRKFIVEQVRGQSAAGGYVITGWADTPITTSGVVDDHGELKFTPEEWRKFNAGRVLAIDRERRRHWVSGGDRPAFKDPYAWWQGESAEVHVLLSNGESGLPEARLDWRLCGEGREVIAGGTAECSGVGGGRVEEIAVLRLPMPLSSYARPVALSLELRLWLAGFGHDEDNAPRPVAENEWPLWAVPRPSLPSKVGVFGSLLHRRTLTKIERSATPVDAAALDARMGIPCLAGELSEALLGFIRRGGKALLWQKEPDSRFTRPMPFWREAIHVFEPHALWQRVPHAGYADMRFYSVATEFALEAPRLAGLLGDDAQITPVWRRFDARAMTWADYLLDVQLGSGRLFVSSLRFEGGLGDQPNALEHNPVGAWMIASLVGAADTVNGPLRETD